MGIFDMFKATNINQGVTECKNTEGAVLVDVRTKGEYGEGHIPGSINVPLDEIRRIEKAVPEKSTPVYTYCLSGARSAQAASVIKSMGYESVKNIGGISRYSGDIER